MKKKGYGTHTFVEIPWPLPLVVDGSARAWVDLEPPLAAAGSGPTMAMWRVHPSTGARTGERARGGAILLHVAHRLTSVVARSLRCAGRALLRSCPTAVHPSISGLAAVPSG
jgi:hypothetical protein